MPLLPSSPPQVRRSRVIGAISLAAALLALFSFIAFYTGRDVGKKQVPPPSGPTFHRLTFRHGHITGARFAPDGQTVIYGARWEGKPSELSSTRSESPESRRFTLRNAGIFSISSLGEMAIALGCTLNWGECMGTLARVPLTGSAPRELLPNVQFADWAPDGKALAVVRYSEGRSRLEYPIGKVLYDTPGWITHLRISARGDLIAFLDHPRVKDIGGSVCVVDLLGKKRDLSTGWKGVLGLAWFAADEIWFSGTRQGKGGSLAVHAVALSGRERVIFEGPSGVAIRDISRDGQRVLLNRGTPRAAMISLAPGSSKEHDLAWLYPVVTYPVGGC